MTFYWWSHWFWITMLSNMLLIFPLIVVVHTYPSQNASQEFNRHQTENSRKHVTKLYQTSTASWSTESSIVLARNTTPRKTVLQSIVANAVTPSPPPHPRVSMPTPTSTPTATATTTERESLPRRQRNDKKRKLDVVYYYYYYDYDDNQTQPLDLEAVEEEMESESKKQKTNFLQDIRENDIKRSAEHFSKSSETESIIMELNPTESSLASSSSASLSSSSSSSAREEKNNYTNFTNQITNATMASSATSSPVPKTSGNTTYIQSDRDSVAASSLYASAASAPSQSILSSQSINNSNSNNISSNNGSKNNNKNNTNNNNNNSTAVPVPHSPPATPNIMKTHNPLDWLNSMADVAVSPPTARATTDPNDDRFPFTLENVHKPEDLRREENEPRTRKSKGLSAEYKSHGYASINYSTSETKNLLTRSASTTVNEYESEESNISSEALSVQRAYFMDVGAISAICFTVFGICCTVGTIGIVLYRRRFLNKPQALSEPDSSVYIDDSTMRVSDNSDEMYSLDNDSFLNSLEAMTIQNYWTDTVKHTKL